MIGAKTMNDYISRQAAIEALNDEYHGMISDESMKIYQIINWLSELPSAQPERKTGEWIIHYGNWADIYECDQCHHESKEGGKYCPHCGAKMEDSDD